jgi:hypothetical protein
VIMSVAARRVAAIEDEIRGHRDRQQVLLWHRCLNAFLRGQGPMGRRFQYGECTYPQALWLEGFVERHPHIELVETVFSALEEEEPSGLVSWLMFCLADLLRNKVGWLERSLALLQQSAHVHGFPLAQGQLALSHFKRREYVEAGRWALMGAGHGELESSPAALHVLSCLYLQGKGGFAKDEKEGFRCLRLAALLNYPIAQHSYARLCCPVNEPEHFYWLGRAAGSGFSDGRSLLEAMQRFDESYASDPLRYGPLIFQIGCSLRGSLCRNLLFDKLRQMDDPQLILARRARSMHDAWCQMTLAAVESFLIVARRLNCRGEAGFMCFPRDVRGIIASLIWETRRDALYVLQ